MKVKPTPKREVGIAYYSKKDRLIHLRASADALADFEDFGSLLKLHHLTSLLVDTRYNFDEVLEYIRAYNE